MLTGVGERVADDLVLKASSVPGTGEVEEGPTTTRSLINAELHADHTRRTGSYCEQMTGKPQAGDAELIVYVDHSDIHEGRLEDLKEGIRRLVDVIEVLEPQLIAYGFHLDEEAGRMTVTAVHPDSPSLELHMEIGKEEFRKLGDMITLRQIQVYGSISERAREMLEQKATMLGGSGVTLSERFAGFARTPQARD
jgi:hypothetical protein